MFFSSALSPFLQTERVQPHAAGRSNTAQVGLHSADDTGPGGAMVVHTGAILKNLIARLAYLARPAKYVLQVLCTVFPAALLPDAFIHDL